ncbi:NAD dependent epimerase/dehydratase family protein [Collimonas fungivorans]|uniref:NAD dependent epimerase/dehydratase family protein n=1 Tax=Collimonas fungivorans TaxID=158899 RepID=A0A127P5Z2_9BURK|nr:NAD-dependent epimerase/dehydratase family protein [Collimonas fungivorans]AMO93108.1 NAD dependent epimerase/dehydratase family protein [Collimonas fungivorans]
MPVFIGNQRGGLNLESTNKTVIVTGGCGYVAGWMIAGLLQRGYRVRTTVRNLASEGAVRKSILSQCDPGDRLSFFSADLFQDAGWGTAMDGCDFVIHVASPMGQGAPKGTDLITPARDGTLRILKAAAAAGVRRVVITSSVAAAQNTLPAGDRNHVETDEGMWTDVNKKDTGDYARSKTLAEKAAWEFIEQDKSGLTLTSILPGMILGPVMTSKVSGSVEIISRMLTGRMAAVPRLGFSIVDVRDLVDLHISAMLSPAAAGQRFIASRGFLWLSEMVDILRRQSGMPTEKLPKRRLPDVVLRLAALFSAEAKFMAPLLGKESRYSHAKATALLDWHPRAAADTVTACAESLVARGIV